MLSSSGRWKLQRGSQVVRVWSSRVSINLVCCTFEVVGLVESTVVSCAIVQGFESCVAPVSHFCTTHVFHGRAADGNSRAGRQPIYKLSTLPPTYVIQHQLLTSRSYSQLESHMKEVELFHFAHYGQSFSLPATRSSLSTKLFPVF